MKTLTYFTLPHPNPCCILSSKEHIQKKKQQLRTIAKIGTETFSLLGRSYDVWILIIVFSWSGSWIKLICFSNQCSLDNLVWFMNRSLSPIIQIIFGSHFSLSTCSHCELTITPCRIPGTSNLTPKNHSDITAIQKEKHTALPVIWTSL